MDMYRYARTRLQAGTFERASFLQLFTKRVVKSLSRVSSTRITSNKWLIYIKALRLSTEDSTFLQEMDGYAADIYKRSPVGANRLAFLLKFIENETTLARNMEDLFQENMATFEANKDTEFFIGLAARENINRGHCGHFTSEASVFRGNAETLSHTQYMCASCAQKEIDAGTRVSTAFYGNNQLILAEHAQQARYYNNELVTIDRRDPAFRFHEARNLWAHREWTPYGNLIADYHSSKRKGFNIIDSPWFRSHRRAFGCELEIQVTTGSAQEAAGRVHEALNPSLDVGEYCFFERDGSIGSSGFELITQPAGLDVHAQKFSTFLQNKDMKRGMRSHEGGSCGFHVHVGRQYLTQSQIYRMQSFLNDVRNQSLIKQIARRYHSGYSKFKHEMAKFSVVGKHNNDRYEALNVTGDQTVEFRIFRGSLRYESIMAALEFVNAVVDFCQPGTTSIMDFNAIGFKRFIMDPNNRTDTKYLRSYLSLNDQDDHEQRIAA